MLRRRGGRFAGRENGGLRHRRGSYGGKLVSQNDNDFFKHIEEQMVLTSEAVMCSAPQDLRDRRMDMIGVPLLLQHNGAARAVLGCRAVRLASQH